MSFLLAVIGSTKSKTFMLRVLFSTALLLLAAAKALAQDDYWSNVISDARAGDIESQWRAGNIYRYGMGVDADIDQAINWYKTAISNGFKPTDDVTTLIEAYSADSPVATDVGSDSGEARINTESLMLCTQETDSLKRLTCYDTAVGFGAESPSSQNTGAWRITNTVNPLTDEARVVLSLTADEGNSVLNTRRLILRCDSGQTDAYISWGDYLGDNGRVTYRIGQAEPVDRILNLSNDNTATFISPASNFIVSLMRANRFVARITPYNDSPVTAVFNTTGLSDAVMDLRRACNW